MPSSTRFVQEPPLSLRYCLPYDLSIIHFRVIQNLLFYPVSHLMGVPNRDYYTLTNCCASISLGRPSNLAGEGEEVGVRVDAQQHQVRAVRLVKGFEFSVQAFCPRA